MPNTWDVKIDTELKELIPNYLKNIVNDTNTLKELVKDGKLSDCRRLGHNMKGSGGSYGFDFISEMGKKIEASALAGTSREIETCAANLEEYLQNVQISYV